MSLADEILAELEPEIESLSLIPSSGGRFEISVNDQLIFSKLQTGYHPDPGEILGMVRDFSKRKA